MAQLPNDKNCILTDYLNRKESITKYGEEKALISMYRLRKGIFDYFLTNYQTVFSINYLKSMNEIHYELMCNFFLNNNVDKNQIIKILNDFYKETIANNSNNGLINPFKAYNWSEIWQTIDNKKTQYIHDCYNAGKQYSSEDCYNKIMDVMQNSKESFTIDKNLSQNKDAFNSFIFKKQNFEKNNQRIEHSINNYSTFERSGIKRYLKIFDFNLYDDKNTIQNNLKKISNIEAICKFILNNNGLKPKTIFLYLCSVNKYFTKEKISSERDIPFGCYPLKTIVNLIQELKNDNHNLSDEQIILRMKNIFGKAAIERYIQNPTIINSDNNISQEEKDIIKTIIERIRRSRIHASTENDSTSRKHSIDFETITQPQKRLNIEEGTSSNSHINELETVPQASKNSYKGKEPVDNYTNNQATDVSEQINPEKTNKVKGHPLPENHPIAKLGIRGFTTSELSNSYKLPLYADEDCINFMTCYTNDGKEIYLRVDKDNIYDVFESKVTINYIKQTDSYEAVYDKIISHPLPKEHPITKLGVRGFTQFPIADSYMLPLFTDEDCKNFMTCYTNDGQEIWLKVDAKHIYDTNDKQVTIMPKNGGYVALYVVPPRSDIQVGNNINTSYQANFGNTNEMPQNMPNMPNVQKTLQIKTHP